MNSNSEKRTVFKVAVVLLILCFIGMGAYFWYISTRPKKSKKPSLMVVGVGLYLSRNQETHKFEITRTFPNSPADKAGLVPGLILNKVNNALAETNNIKQLSAMLMGPVGSKVTVETIDSNDVTNQIELTREQFVNHSKPQAPPTSQ